MAQAARTRSYQNGEFLFQEADPADQVWVLLSGRVRLSQVTVDGQQVIMRYITPVEEFGLLAVLSQAEYLVSAQAIEDCMVMVWEKRVMRRLMQQIPGIAERALEVLVNRIKEFQDRLREMATERVERRIARALLRLASQTGRKTEQGVLIDLPLSRQDLAEMTGTTLFTVSRTLSQWEAKGLILSGRTKIVICFPHGLVTIAEDLPPGKTTD